MDARTQQLALRFLLGLVLTEIPVIVGILSMPNPDWKLIVIGVLGGLAAALEKYLAPIIMPTGTVMDIPARTTNNTAIGTAVAVPLRSLPTVPVVSSSASLRTSVSPPEKLVQPPQPAEEPLPPAS